MLFRNIDIPFLVKSRVLDEPKYSTSNPVKQLLKSLNFELFDQKVSQNPGQKKTYNILFTIYQSRTSNPKSPKFRTHELSILPNSNPKDPKPVSTFFMNRRKRKFKTQMCKKAKYFLLDASSSESESTKKLKALCSQKISIFYIFIALTTRSLKESVSKNMFQSKLRQEFHITIVSNGFLQLLHITFHRSFINVYPVIMRLSINNFTHFLRFLTPPSPLSPILLNRPME